MWDICWQSKFPLLSLFLSLCSSAMMVPNAKRYLELKFDETVCCFLVQDFGDGGGGGEEEFER